MIARSSPESGFTHLLNKLFTYMKKIIFSFAALAIAAMFSFCAKEESLPAAALVDNKATTERGPCSVTVTSNGPVTVCGLRQNTTPCTSCCNLNALGLTVVNGIGNFTGFGQNTFYITNTGATPVTVTITAGSNVLQYDIKPGNCVVGTLLDNCDLSYLSVNC